MKEALQKIETLTAALNLIGRQLPEIQKALDEITQANTTFKSFVELLNAQDFRPSLPKAPVCFGRMEIFHMRDGRKITADLYYAEWDFLALAYDMAQQVRGDFRVVYRYYR